MLRLREGTWDIRATSLGINFHINVLYRSLSLNKILAWFKSSVPVDYNQQSLKIVYKQYIICP